jgi:RNase P/RNase MRP subunit p29
MKRKKEGRKRSMPTELIKEFLGKVCGITLFNTLFNESFGITGKIVSVEGNWLKIEEKDTSRLVNGDMIRDIKIMPAKYQK